MRMMKVAELGDPEDEDFQSKDDLKMADDVEDPANQHINGSKTEKSHPAGWRSLFNFTSRTHILPLVLAILLSIVSGIVIPGLAYFLGKIFNAFTNFGAGELTEKELMRKVT